MPDDKTKVGEPDRSRVSGDQDYEVQQFAEKHGITPREARDLIAYHGSNRQALEEAAKRLGSKAYLWT